MRREIDRLPVVDGKKKLLITITANDVKKGQNKKPGACAAAVCLMRELGCAEARVHLTRTYVRFDKKRWLRYETPHSLRDQIVRYDTSNKFDPGDYEIKPFRPTHKLGAEKSNNPNRPTGPHPKDSPRNKYHRLEGVRAGPFDKTMFT